VSAKSDSSVAWSDRDFLLACGIEPEQEKPATIKRATKPAVAMPNPVPNPIDVENHAPHDSCTCFLGHPPCSFCESYDPDKDDQDEMPGGSQ